MADVSLEQRWSEELHEIAVRRACRHLDVGFFWQLVRRLPAAEGAAGEFDEVAGDMQRVSAHIDGVMDSGEGAELLRRLYLEFIQRRGVTRN